MRRKFFFRSRELQTDKHRIRNGTLGKKIGCAENTMLAEEFMIRSWRTVCPEDYIYSGASNYAEMESILEIAKLDVLWKIY